MACIRKVGHTSRCISPLCSSLRFTVNIPIRPNRRRSTRGGSKQATNQPTNPSTGRNGLLKRRYEGGTRGRRERSTTVEFIRTTFVTSTRSIAGLRQNLPPSHGKREEGHARLMLDQIYSVIEHRFFRAPRMLFQLSKDVDL